MSENNKQIVEKVNAAFAENRMEGFFEACAGDVRWTMVGEGSYKGKEAVREFMSSMEGQEPPKFSVDRIIAEGDSVVCYGDMTMKDKEGVEGKYSYCDVYRFSGAKIAELRSFVVKHKPESETWQAAA